MAKIVSYLRLLSAAQCYQVFCEGFLASHASYLVQLRQLGRSLKHSTSQLTSFHPKLTKFAKTLYSNNFCILLSAASIVE